MISRGRQTQERRDLRDVLAVRRVVAGGDAPELPPRTGRGRCVIELAKGFGERLRRQTARIEMDHERTIGRHGLVHAFPIRLSDGRVERQNPVMDLGVDGVAEFDNERQLSGGQIAWQHAGASLNAPLTRERPAPHNFSGGSYHKARLNAAPDALKSRASRFTQNRLSWRRAMRTGFCCFAGFPMA